MKNPTVHITRHLVKIADVMLAADARQALKVLAPDLVVQATRVMWDGKFGRRGSLDIRFTAGRPNYLARRFIKACKKAGEPFPVKKIQLRFPAKHRR